MKSSLSNNFRSAAKGIFGSRQFRVAVVLAVVATVATAAAVTTPLGAAFGSFLSGMTGGSNAKAQTISNAKVNNANANPVLAFFSLEGANSLVSPRAGHSATKLGDGRVLIAGGDDAGSAEIFDPVSDTSSATGNLASARAGHTATLLSDGRVLIAGGDVGGSASDSTEIFDPATGEFIAGPTMNAVRSGHTATAMPDGSILIAGGGTAEIYDPSSSSFTMADSAMVAARSNHSAVLMNDGRVFIAGGEASDSAEIFDPSSGGFVAAGSGMAHPRSKALLRVLPDGKIQIIGGSDDASMEVYDPSIDTIGAHGHLIPTDDEHDALLLSHILGSPTRAALYSAGNEHAELDRAGHSITELGDQAIVAGGANGAGSALGTFDIFPSSDATVTTDKLDYQPGDTAVISGTGWAAGEIVDIIIHEDPHTHTERRLTATADGNGDFSANYSVEEHDLNVTFVIGAKGLSSGRTAQTTFTDARNTTLTFAGTGSGSVTITISAGGTVEAPASCGGTGSAGSSQTVTSTCSPNISTNPNGATVTFSASPNAGSAFGGWSGQSNLSSSTCSGTTNPCSAVLVSNPALTVTFNAATNPVPTTTSISPSSKFYGDAGFVMTVNGTNFIASSVVRIGGVDRATTFVSSTQLTATITSSDLLTVGNRNITVFNPAPGGGTSNAQVFTVNKAPLTVTADNASREYGDANPAFSATLSGFKNGETLATSGVTGSASCSSAATPASSVAGGPYAITCTAGTLAAGNYDFSPFVDGSLTITKANLTVTANNASREYGDANPAFSATLSGFKNGETLATSGVTGSASCSSAATPASSVAGGPYAITCTAGTLAAGNYDFSPFVDGELTVDPKAATVTADDRTKTYGDLVVFTGTEYTTSGFILGDGVTSVTLNSAGAAEGASVAGSPYAITPSAAVGTGLGNYNITYVDGELTVDPKAASVTPDPASKTYGDADPSFTGTLDGFLAGDNVTATYSRTAGETVAGSPYTISATLSPVGVLGNYNITYNTAAFTIGPKPLIATITANDKVYDGNTNATITGCMFTNVVGIDDVSCVITGYTANFDTALVGTNKTVTANGLTMTGADIGNYSFNGTGTGFASILAWTLDGFFQPVGIQNTYRVLNPAPFVWNTIKAGQTVPLKFRIFAGMVERTDIGAIDRFIVQQVGCNTTPGEIGDYPIEPESTSGGTTLRYSGTPGIDGQFIQNWQSPKQANVCYRVVMMSKDGSMLVSMFKTKK